VDTSILTHLLAGVIGAIAGYTVSIKVNSNKRVQNRNVAGGHISGGDMNIDKRD
jgi:hypothetical protein